MLSRKFIKIWLILLTIATAALLIGSCSNTKPEGPLVINHSPKIEIVNIPPDNSHFTTNPQIYWFGTDVDGKIVTYEYAVVPAALLIGAQVDTSSDSAILTYAGEHISSPAAGRDCKPESCWQQIDVEQADNPNKQTIRLFADADPSVNITQYFFVRAVDNDSARSNIDYRLYSRTNHPPETEIKSVPDTTGYYDLSDTSKTYKGIFFEWKGTDKIDYPDDNQNPTFEYFYRVFGPYQKDEIFGLDSLGKYVFDHTKVDVTQTEKLVMTSHDSISPNNVWVSKNSARIYGVWTKQPPSDTTRSGYFVLEVTARDDAFVSDATPAYVPFFTIDAKFENDLLVYIPFFCVNSAQSAGIDCGIKVDSMFAFYKRVIARSGYDSSKVLLTPGGVNARNRPSKLELAKYKVYLMIDDGKLAHIMDSCYMDATPYLDLGGSVWVWGLSPFGDFHGGSGGGAKLNSLAQKQIPNFYFDVVGEFSGGWGPSYETSMNVFLGCTPPPPCPKLPSNEEFLGGLTLTGDMPDFDVDSLKYSSTYSGFAQYPPTFRAAPNTNYFQRYGYSEPLWLFRSRFGDEVPDSLENYVVGLHGRVIALRYQPPLTLAKFKTAVYGFSMYMLPEEQAVDIFTKSMAWFLKPR
jgi:hypothetical protein